MAIIVDPDNLDRQQMIFGTNSQKMSFYPVGALRASEAADGSVGVAGSPVGLSSEFNSASAAFDALVDIGRHIIIQSGNNIGSYEITAVNSATQVVVDRDFAVTESSITFNLASGTTAASTTFTDLNADWVTDGVTAGDILAIYSGPDAGHYRVASVTDLNNVVVDTFEGFTAFGTYGALGSPSFEVIAYTFQLSSGGSAADGATIQAMYSFGKEEWRVDSMQYNRDDLIKHEFPFEAITSEQFEIGGGTAHFDWTWHNGPLDTDETIHYIRTGGWADIDNASVTSFQYTGIITLGSIDTDAQVYFQQLTTATDPENFVLLGPVNQAILILDTAGSPDDDRRTYLKLFVRKKTKTYAGSEILDIGVTTIQTIVNRFPLAHADDSAIIATDGALVSTTPYFDAVVDKPITGAQTDGVTVAATGTFTSATASFIADGVRIGDSLRLTAGAVAADTYPLFTWNIVDVVDANTLTVSIADQAFTGDTGVTFAVFTSDIDAPLTDGVIADVTTVTGTLSSATGGFTAAGIAAGDMVVINEPSNIHSGVYKVITNDTDNQLTLDTTDRAFVGGTLTAIDFYITEPGMYLEFKFDVLVAAALDGGAGFDFANANPDTITSTGTPWAAVTAGDIVTVANSTVTANDGLYTVASATSSEITLVATDTLTADTNDTTATIAVNVPFKRTISSVVYGFGWRLFGNNGLASECYQFIQHQLRQNTDIDFGDGVSRGDITDLLMSFSSPTGVTTNLIIDDIASADLNNVTFGDATGVGRLFAFVAAGKLIFNNNLQGDSAAKYWMFFTNDDAGDNTGRDYGTKDAIIVLDASETPAQITGNIGGVPEINFTYDYDFNVQRGAASAQTDAPVTVVAIGLDTAQFVITTGTIESSKTNNFSLVAALERNYST